MITANSNKTQEIMKIKNGEVQVLEATGQERVALVARTLVGFVKEHKACAVFTMTEPKVKLAQHSLCEFSDIDINKALDGKLAEQDWYALYKAKKVLGDNRVYTDDDKDLTLQEIAKRCLKIEDNDVVIIDCIQAIKGYSKDTIETDLTTLAKELNVAIVAFN